MGLIFPFQFGHSQDLQTTANGYVFVRIYDGDELTIMLIDPNQEPPTCHLVTTKMVTYVVSFPPSLISPHYGRNFIGV